MKKSKPTDFAYMLSRFLSFYLPGQRNFSPNTILSYRDTFKFLLVYMRDEKHLPQERVTLENINRKMIGDFIHWLHHVQGNSEATCNQRLGAIHSFFNFLQYEKPEKILLCQEVMGIRMMRAPERVMNYLTVDGVKEILAMPDITTKNGRRDLTLLSLLYDTGARVQELCDLTIEDVRFVFPATIRLTGKGNKARIVPLLSGTEKLLKSYIDSLPLQHFIDNRQPLFCNRMNQKFTRAGVTYLFLKYADQARTLNPKLIPKTLSPHCFRHSKAMHLLQANVNLIYIRDLLGHRHVKTTEKYARADSDSKRQALEKGNPIKSVVQFPTWTEDSGLIDWLQNLGKKG